MRIEYLYEDRYPTSYRLSRPLRLLAKTIPGLLGIGALTAVGAFLLTRPTPDQEVCSKILNSSTPTASFVGNTGAILRRNVPTSYVDLNQSFARLPPGTHIPETAPYRKGYDPETGFLGDYRCARIDGEISVISQNQLSPSAR